MKKLLSVLLALIFIGQALPAEVIAEAINPLPTRAELTAAVALTGLDSEAPGYRSGMKPSVNMNAMQLAGWIHEFQQDKLAYIMDTFENYDVELSYVQEHYPNTFEMLRGYSEAGIGQLYSEYNNAKDWRDDVHYYESLLTQTASRIDVLAEYLQDSGLTQREQAIYSYEIRDGWRTLEALIPEIVQRTTAWDQEFERLDQLLTGSYEYVGSDESLAWLLEAVDDLRTTDGRTASTTFSVSASTVRVAPDQTVLTRLARLSPISVALADSDQKMTVKILDDKSFGFNVVDGEARVSGASVTVSQKGNEGKTQTTDHSGAVLYAMREFQNDSDGEAQVDVKVSAPGYRRLSAPAVWVKKGQAMNIPLVKDNGKPYLVSWSFWGNDMQVSKYGLVTSPLNDTTQPIALTVSSPAGYHLKVYFTDKDSKNPVLVGEADGALGERTHTFEGQWLMKAPAEGKLFAEITSNSETQTYQAQLELKASVLKKPLGDPKFNKALSPGFQITLPKGWVKPFGGMNIEVNLPVTEKFQVRGYFDINGNGALTIGTKILEDQTKELTQNWKTKDQKALDKAVKEVKGQGYMAETKAKNGGDWNGRSKWRPMRLGAISLDISFFAFVQVQYSEDGYDYGQIFGKGGAGFTGTLKGSYALMWPLAQLSAFVSATFTIFPEVAVMLDTYWPTGREFPEFRSFEYVKGALNILLRIEVGFEACVGLKGIASLSIRGVGFLEFAIRAGATMDLASIIEDFKHGKFDPNKHVDTKKELTIYAGGSVDVILEVLWAKATYPLIDPPFKYMLYPEFKKAEEPATQNLVQRFIASLISTANAEAEDEPQEGGAQVDTGNRDLMISGSVVETWNDGAGKTEVFSMRPLGSDQSVPMMLYLSKTFNDQGRQYNRPVLVGTPLNDLRYVPLICQNGMTGDLQDHYLPADGYDVIDFAYWVADATPYGTTTFVSGRGDVPLNDALFTVCILARDYHQEQETLEDGTIHQVQVPNETWAYVSCYCLDGTTLRHVILPQEKDTNNYLSMCYPLRDYDGRHDPSADPRLFGMIRTRYSDPDSLLYQYALVTNPIGVENMQQKSGFCVGDVVYANWTYDRRVKGALENRAQLIGKADRFMRDKQFGDYRFFTRDNDNFTRFCLAENAGADAGLYELEFGVSTANAVGTPGIQTREGMTFMTNVVSMAGRPTSNGYPHAFVVQKVPEEERYRLMGCALTSMYSNVSQYYWDVRDFDVDMPRTDLQWTRLYGRECVYWTETAGQTEDGTGNLFKVRAVWYDETANAVSEPFVIATVRTPTTDGAPLGIYLAGNNEGFYFVQRETGARQLYRFNFQLVPGLNLVGNVLTETLANPGSYDAMLLTVFNNGNIPLTGFDVKAYHEVNGQAAKSFETIHVDLLKPEDSYIETHDAKGLYDKTKRYGDHIARVEASSFAVDGEDYRYNNTKTYYNGKLMEEKNDLMKPNVLMPNTYKAFDISLLIPAGWEGTHQLYMEVDRYYTTNDSSFQKRVGETSGGAMLLKAAASEPEIISIGRDGTVRRENGGGMLLAASAGAETNTAEDFSMYKTDVTFDRISLDTSARDLSIMATRWDNNGVPMVSLTVTNWAHIASSSRRANTVVMEAFMDEETTPVFRYNLQDEVSDKETWNFDLPLSLLTDNRSGSKVTVKIRGKDYKEVGEVDNSVVILLDTESLSFSLQPGSQTVPAGSGTSFHAAVAGGRAPYVWQWQTKAPGGAWTDLAGEHTDTLSLTAVTREMDGTQYRLTVTDASDYSVTSSAATLTVKKVPSTGDTTPVLWYAAGILAAACVILYMALTRKKENEAR